MFEIIALNAVLFLFLVLSIFWQRPHIKLKKVSHTNNKVHPYILAVFAVFWIGFLLFLLIKGGYWIRNIYITTNFLILVLLNTFWLTTQKPLYLKVTALILSLILYFFAIFSGSTLAHNLVIFASVLWVGPFLTRINLLTHKRFLIISMLWFLYDIVFVWVTPLHSQVSIGTDKTIFSLGIQVGDYFLGAGDLLYANILLSILNENRTRLLATVVLVGSNLVLVWLALSTRFILAFPLLVLWVPIGTALLYALKSSPISHTQKKK